MEWTSVKKGWVYQRKKHLIFPTSWSPKYVVLYSGPIPALAVYEQRSDAMPPYAPLLHLELTGGLVSVGTAHGSGSGVSGSGGFWSHLGSSISSRKASIVSTLSRRGSFRDLSAAAAAHEEKHGNNQNNNKSYKERMLDDQGFMVHREASDGQPGLKLCFATESREERDAWMTEIQTLIDTVNRKQMNSAAAQLFTMPAGNATDSGLVREMNALAVRSESSDMSIVCCGVKVLDHRAVKRMLKETGQNVDSDDDVDSDGDEIQIIQIIESSNTPRSTSGSFVPDDLNLKYQQAIDEKRRCKRGDEDGRKRSELALLKLSGSFSRSVSSLMKRTIDNLHTTRSPLTQGTLHEDTLCRIQFVADYQAGCSDEEAREWLHQEMLAARWCNGQDDVPIHCMVMTEVEYKGFRAVGMLKLPVSAQTTLVFDIGNGDEDGIVSESCLMIMRDLAKSLHLIPSYPWRLGDGRTIQMALHPTVQVHQIQQHTMAPTTGVMVVGRQAGKIHGGTAATTFTPSGYYLLNLGEILPVLGLEDGTVIKARPELVVKAQANVGSGTLHADATSSALQPLLREAIGRLSKDLEEDLSILPLDSLQWTELLHSRGINMSLLGSLASRAKLPHLQEGLAIEMLARTLKRAVRSQLRQTVLHFREVQALLVEEELANIAVSTVNALLAPADASKEWKLQLLQAVEANYGYAIGLERLRGLPKQALLMAVQHHCGFQFKSDAVLAVAEELPLEPGHFVKFLPKCAHTYELGSNDDEAFEDEDDGIRMMIAENLLTPKAQGDLGKASLAAQFERLALATRDETYIRLARNTCPQSHVHMASILLSELDLSKSVLDLPLAIRTHQQASEIVKGNLGEHHPYQLVISERFTDLLRSKYEGVEEAIWEALRVRQQIQRDAAKILGKSHTTTKAQFNEIGDLQLKLGEWDGAIQSYREARKVQPSGPEGIESQITICLKLSDAHRQKEDTEAALQEVQSCRTLIEKELPKRTNNPEARQRLLKIQEEVLLRLAKLSQSVLDEAPCSGGGDQMISAETEAHLLTAIDCYERIFEVQRARTESNTEGERLLEILQQIISLKLKLAPPAARTVIKLVARQQGVGTTSDEKEMHDLLVRLLSGPVTPSAWMERLLEKAASPETMKEVEAELKAVVQFTSSL